MLSIRRRLLKPDVYIDGDKLIQDWAEELGVSKRSAVAGVSFGPSASP